MASVGLQCEAEGKVARDASLCLGYHVTAGKALQLSSVCHQCREQDKDWAAEPQANKEAAVDHVTQSHFLPSHALVLVKGPA